MAVSLQMPGYTFRRMRRDSRFVFEWRADELGVLDSYGIMGLFGRTYHVPHFDRTGAAGFAGYALDRWQRVLEPPLVHPRYWSWDLDDDGEAETIALLTEQGATNMVNNSYCGTNTTGWTPQASASVARVSVLDTGAPPLLGYCGKITVTEAGAAGAVSFFADSNGFFDTTAGQFYALLAVVTVPVAGVGQPWTFYIDWRDAGGGLLSSTAVPFTPTRSGRRMVAVLGTAPTNGTNASLRLYPGTLIANPVSLYIEHLQLVWSAGCSIIPADTTQAALATLAGEAPPYYTFPELISPLGCTLYAKAIVPWGTAGGPLRSNATVLCLGINDSAAGGTLEIGLSVGIGFAARRVGATTGLISTAQLPNTLVQPLEFLAHQQPDGAVDVAVRDAVGALYSSTPDHPNDRCSAHPGTVGQTYGTAALVLGGSGAGNVSVPGASGVGILRACYTTGLRDWAAMSGKA